MIPAWMSETAEKAEKVFSRHGVKLTMGGEPTFIPLSPDGPEWNFVAVGPTKLLYANQLGDELMKEKMAGAAKFFCPGKLYPGETNPRWVVRLITNRDGTPFFRQPAHGHAAGLETIKRFAKLLSKHLGATAPWTEFADPNDAASQVLSVPLDHDGESWNSARWTLPKNERVLSGAEGDAGLRLPLHLIPPDLPKRVLTLERKDSRFIVFIPPLLQDAFIHLISAIEKTTNELHLAGVELHGYTASDSANLWTTIGLAADPGVLEINLPPCSTWRQYAEWMETLTVCAEKVGLRSWKETPWDHPQGSGGGNHFLWGGPSLDEHPFFTRPQWLAAVLRFWQHHPSLAYLFTGCYVGASSQAPRPDESARDLYDIDMAYAFIEGLPPGDHRSLINETLRHIQTDVTGNSHRSEISFDKFWNTAYPSGALGLIEFRAIEAVPTAQWASAIALLWTTLAAYLLEAKPPKGLKRFGTKLLDEYFLPSRLWDDLSSVLSELRRAGYHLDEKLYREIWAWRFPAVLVWGKKEFTLTVRKALESWPLLCETPVEGGSTSRFVDTSMQRFEFLGSPGFDDNFEMYVAGRPLPLQARPSKEKFAGLRYRRTNLYPSLHPGIPTQLPLIVTIVDRKSGRVAAEFEMGPTDIVFRQRKGSSTVSLGDNPCRGGRRGDITYDLRLA